MSTQKVVSANAYKIKNSATVLFGGAANTSGRAVTQVRGIETMGYHSGKAGSVVTPAIDDAGISANAAGDAEPAVGRSHSGTYKPYSAGTFAYQAPAKYIAMRLTNTISGVANTVLQTGAGDFNRNTRYHVRGGIRTTTLTVFTWTGGYENGIRLTKTYSNLNPTQNHYKDDDEAARTRALPGELVYMYGTLLPLQGNYPARTG